MTETATESVDLKVMRALGPDTDKKRIRLARKARDKLGVGPGDTVVARHDDRRRSLTVFKSDKALVGKGACRLDGDTRKYLGVKVGDRVTIVSSTGETVSIKATIDPRKYDLVVTERAADNPFQISEKLAKIAARQTTNRQSALAKAKALFAWVHSNVQYGGHRPRGIGYRDSIETKVAGEGVCGEMAFLYVAMARVVGLVASFVIVDRDFRGKRVNHACAGVRIAGKQILVDPAYHSFDIAHKEIRVMSDLQAHAAFRSMRTRRPVLFPRATP